MLSAERRERCLKPFEAADLSTTTTQLGRGFERYYHHPGRVRTLSESRNDRIVGAVNHVDGAAYGN
jgi:hypothetical protein